MKIEVHGISKKYLLKTALDSVTASFDSGKIHALVGDNGAGKSTLASIISGNIEPSEGQLIIDNEEVHFASAKNALAKGIVIVHQRPNLASSLKVKENIALSLRYSTENKINHTGFFLTHTPDELEALRQKWAPSVSMNSYVKDIGGNLRFYVSLLSALMRHPQCLILDEPSAFLDQDERKKLYENLKTLSKSGTNIIIITHSAAEASTYANTITVLKDGKLEGNFFSGKDYSDYLSKNSKSAFIPQESLLQKIESKTAAVFEKLTSKPKNRPSLFNADFIVNYGEITAITGLKEAALGTLEDVVTAMDTSWSSGKVTLTSKDNKTISKDIKLRGYSPRFLRKMKVAIVPSDRTYRATNPDLTVEEMLSVYVKKDKKDYAYKLIHQAQISITSDQKVSSLSGGMMQRLILEREFNSNPSIIILCNPMQGLDIESQGKLCKRIIEAAKEGCGILIIGASDFPLTVCSKVYQMESGFLKLAYSAGESK